MTSAPSRIASLAALLALLACAGPRAAVAPGGAGGRALEALVAGNDAAAARASSEGELSRRPADPWARLAASLLARRGLDPDAEARHLVALAGAAPEHPLAPFALRRLAELAEESPALARAVEAGLAPLAAGGRLAGLAAYRARVGRISAAEVLGDHARAAALRRENGAVSAWTLAGPFGVHRNLDLDRTFPPDSGTLPESAPGPLGLPPRQTRAIPAPDGSLSLDGEPRDGELFYLASDVTLSRGGRYLVAVGTGMSVRFHVDGVPVFERRAFAAHLPTLVHLPLDLAAGKHRVLVKAARSGSIQALNLTFARADGAASDATFAAPPPGPPPPPPARLPPARVAPAFGAAEVAAVLAREAGPGLGALLAGRDAMSVDPEAAKALLAEAARLLPLSAAVRAARAELLLEDATLDPQVARARGEAELREALARDAGHAEVRTALGAILVEARRLDDADEALAALGDAAGRPAALAVLAKAADARGLSERAEALVDEALRAGAGCGALDHGRELAARRRAMALADGRARASAECRDGRERLARHLRRRGDAQGVADALRPLVAARPWAVEPALALAEALVAAGAPGEAAEALGALRALWPRNARIEKQLADALELAGDPRAARAARERALLLDGGDLPLRRALALEDGAEVLDRDAEDGGAAIRAYEAAKGRKDDTSSAMVLDAAAVELHPGGDATERTHQVIHVLDQQAVEQFGEVNVPDGGEVLRLRTHKRDGRTLEPERTAGEKGTVSLAGLEPGDYVELEFLRGVRGDGAGLAADPFFFRAEGTRLFRSSYVVSAPEGLGLEVDAHGMAAPPVAHEGGREVVRGLALDVPAYVPEPGAPPATELLPFLHVGVGGGREALQRTLADAAAGRTRSTVELRAAAAEVRAAAGPGASPLAIARAAWAHVSRTILGQGGAFGDEASAVLSRGRGSRLVVLKALLAELGLRARVALARPFGADASAWRFTPRGLYSQPLLRVEAGGETIWTDPGLRVAAFGAFPASVADVEALVLPEPGEALEVARTPARAAVEETREISVTIALEPGGGATVSGEDRYQGATAAATKGALERLDATERRQVVESMLARSFRGVVLSEASFTGEDDLGAPLVLRWRGHVPGLARPTADGGLVLETPVLPARLGPRYAQLASRRTPLLVSAPERVTLRTEVTAPEGLLPVAAAPRAVEGPLGAFARSERVEGRTLVREQRLSLERGRIAPERYPELAAFAAEVDGAEEAPAVFRAGPAGEPPPQGAPR